MVDYFIVGSGLAGIAFAEQALQHNKSILVFDNQSSHSSKVAGGIYNPVILKRFSGLSGAQQQLDEMNLFYRSVSHRLGQDFNHPMPVLRKFASIEEQNNWFAASDKPSLSPFLSTKLVTTKFPFIMSPFDYGEVWQTGFVDTKAFVKHYQQYLKGNGMLADATFEYDILETCDNSVSYRGLQARRIVFADGFGNRNNPYFNYLPLTGTKGELLIVRAPGLEIGSIIKSDVFIIPLGNHEYKVGATYQWSDKTETPTEDAKQELTEKLEKLISCNFKIVSHEAGIRPTVKDRKPLIGTHAEYKNIHILNGLGTRGVMLAPAMAKALFDHIESGVALPPETDIKRFTFSPRQMRRSP